MAAHRGVAAVLAAVVFVSVVTASVGVVAAGPGDDTLDGEIDENTTDSVDDTSDTTEDTTDSVDDGTDDGTTDGETTDAASVGETTNTVDDSTDGEDATTDDGTTDDATGVTEVTAAVTEAGNLVNASETVTATSGALGQVTDATTATLDGTTDALSGTLTTDASGSGLLASSSGDSTAESFESSETTDAEQRESKDWAREKNQATDDEATAATARSASDPQSPDSSRPAPRRLPLPERTATATVFVAGMVAIARPPAVTSSGANQLRTVASQRLSAGLEDVPGLLAPLGYSRYDDSDPLDHDARTVLFDAIQAQPGVYLSELSERTGVNLSTARHHVRVLEDEDLVTSAKPRGKRRYYPAATDNIELAAALSEPATAAVLEALADLGDAHVGLLANELDRDPSTVSHHLQRLADDGLVERERRGRAVVSRLADPVADTVAGHEPAVADD